MNSWNSVESLLQLCESETLAIRDRAPFLFEVDGSIHRGFREIDNSFERGISKRGCSCPARKGDSLNEGHANRNSGILAN